MKSGQDSILVLFCSHFERSRDQTESCVRFFKAAIVPLLGFLSCFCVFMGGGGFAIKRLFYQLMSLASVLLFCVCRCACSSFQLHRADFGVSCALGHRTGPVNYS